MNRLLTEDGFLILLESSGSLLLETETTTPKYKGVRQINTLYRGTRIVTNLYKGPGVLI